MLSTQHTYLLLKNPSEHLKFLSSVIKKISFASFFGKFGLCSYFKQYIDPQSFFPSFVTVRKESELSFLSSHSEQRFSTVRVRVEEDLELCLQYKLLIFAESAESHVRAVPLSCL